MREWGAEAVTSLIKAGLAYKHDPPLSQNQVSAPSWKTAYYSYILFMLMSISSVSGIFMMVVESAVKDISLKPPIGVQFSCDLLTVKAVVYYLHHFHTLQTVQWDFSIIEEPTPMRIEIFR